MNLQQSFTCPVCLQLAKQAVETECCAKIYCERCIQDIQLRFGECPCCRSRPIAWHPSRIARKVISQIKVPCPSCEAKVQSGALEAHLGKCPKVPLQCRICKETLLQEQIPKHTATVHQKEAKEYLIAFALGRVRPESKENKVKMPIGNDPTNYFKPMTNRFGLTANLGNPCKYYCGGKLEGACGCCDGSCGPDNGQNCDACMQLDVQRWNLGKGFLLNTAGYPCQAVAMHVEKRYGVCCFRVLSEASVGLFSSTKSSECDLRNPCDSCLQVAKSINNLGRYKGLY